MGKRGPKPKGKVKLLWSANFAYAVGLLASDGCLSPSGRHIVFTSKDLELVMLFQEALGIVDVRVAKKASKSQQERKYFLVQFSDTLFYNFLLGIGLTPKKSKTIGAIRIPSRYFFDFLRGSFDGDGSTYSYFDPRWRSSFMFYTVFTSASKNHILWLQSEINKRLKIRGHITGAGKFRTAYQLKYAKADSMKLLPKIYNSKENLYLSRKRLKINNMLGIIGAHL